MGRYLGWAGRRIAPIADAGTPDHRVFALGALAWCAGAIVVGAVGWGLQCALVGLAAASSIWGAAVAIVMTGLALKPMLAWRMLRDEVAAVEAALGKSLAAGRARLAFLVSRDVSQLTESEVRESAIESLAENLNDSVVAPIFWFVLFGLPGAVVYRFANTADAMWGYRGLRGGRDWEWAGKWAARADDVLSWVPARLTAWLLQGRGVRWRTLRTEAARTPSPNSGWPMAAMALRLGVRLRKPGVYGLNAEGRAPQPADALQALALARAAVWYAALAASAVLLLRAWC